MKNPAPYLRKAFFDLLNGVVTYNSNQVPVKEKGGKREVPYMILLGELTLNDRTRDKNSFSGNGSLLIEVIHEGTGTVYHKNVDEIGEIVMNLIHPTPRAVIDADEFQVIGLRKESQNYLDESSSSGGFITRLLLRYSFYINQINIAQES